MRIISGKWGGRRISPPGNMPHTRPTTDIAKEGLFNILQNRMDFEGASTLDLFGGTGCISYELGSRGAADMTIVEKDNTMHAFIRKYLDMLGAEGVIAIDANVASATVKETWLETMFPEVAVMRVIPTPAEVTSPLLPIALLIVATLGVSEAQVTLFVISRCVPSL